MNYLRSIWKLEDKFRIIAIFVIAIAVLLLSLFNITVMHNGNVKDANGHMQMRM